MWLLFSPPQVFPHLYLWDIQPRSLLLHTKSRGAQGTFCQVTDKCHGGACRAPRNHQRPCMSGNSPTMQDVHDTTAYVSALNSSHASENLLLVEPIIPSGSPFIKQDLIVHRMNPLRVLEISVVSSYWARGARDFKIAKYGHPACTANLCH